uniref:RRM domain-containing protein n=1 Tax=Clastoptera arizonana TaxID=38151 RepID=A0A1B6DAL4_9HEMI
MAVQPNGISSITPGLADERKLFVGGTGRNITDKELSDYFGKYGEIESITIKNDPVTGMSRGFAFILFKNAKTVDDLLAAGDHYIGNKKVDPKRVTKKTIPVKM